jgi:hypothetical protein
MANVQYANPFGAYVQGQEQGTENAIRTGTAARQFRASDLSPEVQRWYLPTLQREMEARTASGETGANSAQGQYLARLAASGDPHAVQLYQNFLRATTGQNINITQDTPQHTALIANMMSGELSTGGLDPNATFYGAHGVGRYVPGQGGEGIQPLPGENQQQFMERMGAMRAAQMRELGVNGQQGQGAFNFEDPMFKGINLTAPGTPATLPFAKDLNENNFVDSPAPNAAPMAGAGASGGVSPYGAPMPTPMAAAGVATAPKPVAQADPSVYPGTGPRQPGQIWHGPSGGVSTGVNAGGPGQANVGAGGGVM